VISLPHLRRVFAISDLHTDDRKNFSWLVERCSGAGPPPPESPGEGDALIVAGDISHDLDTVRETLRIIREGLGCTIFFVPGNHEAWVGGSVMEAAGIFDSMTKLELVREACVEAGVYCCDSPPRGEAPSSSRPFLLGAGAGRTPALLLPVPAWYDDSLSLPGCDDLVEGFAAWPWVDFARCVWPREYLREGEEDRGTARIPSERLVHALLDTRGPLASHARSYLRRAGRSGAGLISYSHFLPCGRTLPDWKDVRADVFDRESWFDHGAGRTSAKFARVAGSALIDEHVRSVGREGGGTMPHLHVFGHSHRPKDFVWQGVRYIHNPVGKPRERESGMVGRDVDFQLIWDADAGGPVQGPVVIRHWEEQGGGLEGIRDYMERRRRRERVMRYLRRRKMDVMFGRRGETPDQVSV